MGYQGGGRIRLVTKPAPEEGQGEGRNQEGRGQDGQGQQQAGAAQQGQEHRQEGQGQGQARDQQGQDGQQGQARDQQGQDGQQGQQGQGQGSKRQDPHVAKLEGVKVADLAVRVGAHPTAMFCHLGCCEHLVQVSAHVGWGSGGPSCKGRSICVLVQCDLPIR